MILVECVILISFIMGILLNAWTNQPTFSKHSTIGMTTPIVQMMKLKLKEFVIRPWLAMTDPIASE